uniref:Copper transport protein n=1 Tax=Timema cristinae TaxID=61476 RepID=A0A7R9DBI0_TIMCR|nr:unnamed protein product [Timema cristinae]
MGYERVKAVSESTWVKFNRRIHVPRAGDGIDYVMHSSYWWGTSLGDLLFKGYSINSVAGLVMTCLGLASLAVLFEAMKVVQATTKQGLHITSLGDSCPNECSPLLGAANIRRRRDKRTWGLLCQTGLYLFQDTLGYLLMLCVMTYNGYFTVAVSLGAGLGYLVFGPALIEIGFNSASKICGACTDRLDGSMSPHKLDRLDGSMSSHKLDRLDGSMSSHKLDRLDGSMSPLLVRTNRDATDEVNGPTTSLTDTSKGLVNSVMELNEPVPGDRNPCCQAEMSSMLNVHGEVHTDSD